MDAEPEVSASPYYVGKPGRCLECRGAVSEKSNLYVECGMERLYGPLCLRHAESELTSQANDGEA